MDWALNCWILWVLWVLQRDRAFPAKRENFFLWPSRQASKHRRFRPSTRPLKQIWRPNQSSWMRLTGGNATAFGEKLVEEILCKSRGAVKRCKDKSLWWYAMWRWHASFVKLLEAICLRPAANRLPGAVRYQQGAAQAVVERSLFFAHETGKNNYINT